MIDSAGAYRYYSTDLQGSIRATTGPAGGVRDRGSYEAFGSTSTVGGGAVTNDGNPLAFTGQYLDSTTGLYDMRARNYDPSVGRFTSLDPLGYRDVPQASTYGYARNNPLRYTDPSGMGSAGNKCGSVWCFLKSRAESCGAGSAAAAGGAVVFSMVVSPVSVGALAIMAAFGCGSAYAESDSPGTSCLTQGVAGGSAAYFSALAYVDPEFKAGLILFTSGLGCLGGAFAAGNGPAGGCAGGAAAAGIPTALDAYGVEGKQAALIAGTAVAAGSCAAGLINP